jgi:hypothetical protein
MERTVKGLVGVKPTQAVNGRAKPRKPERSFLGRRTPSLFAKPTRFGRYRRQIFPVGWFSPRGVFFVRKTQCQKFWLQGCARCGLIRSLEPRIFPVGWVFNAHIYFIKNICVFSAKHCNSALCCVGLPFVSWSPGILYCTGSVV